MKGYSRVVVYLIASVLILSKLLDKLAHFLAVQYFVYFGFKGDIKMDQIKALKAYTCQQKQI